MLIDIRHSIPFKFNEITLAVLTIFWLAQQRSLYESRQERQTGM